MSHIDFKALIEPVARYLLGEPNPQLSSKTELRFGTKGSFSVNLITATWYDHEADEGGGLLDLIRREIADIDPIEWLRREGYIDRPDSTGEKWRKIDPWEEVLANIPETVADEVHDGTRVSRTIVYRTPEEERVASQDLLTHVLGVPLGHQDGRHWRRLKSIMTRNGWQYQEKTIRIGGKPTRGYRRLLSLPLEGQA